MQRSERGFTLIELMIVIAILGIIAAIAIPAYQEYSIRSKVSEAINVSSASKAAVSDYFWAHNVWPVNRTEAGAANVDTKYVTLLTVIGNGIISIDVDEATTGVAGYTTEDLYILLIPTLVSGAFDWRCTSNNTPDGTGDNVVVGRYAPASCR